MDELLNFVYNKTKYMALINLYAGKYKLIIGVNWTAMKNFTRK